MHILHKSDDLNPDRTERRGKFRHLLVKDSRISKNVDWVVDEHIEPLEFPPPLLDGLPVVDQHLDRINYTFHGVEAVRHSGCGLLDVSDAEASGRDPLELHTLDVTVGERLEGDGVNGHALDVEPLASRGAELLVLTESFGVDLSGDCFSMKFNISLSIR